MVQRAHALGPKLAARAEACEKLRRLPDDTERDLHDAGLFRFVQPAARRRRRARCRHLRRCLRRAGARLPVDGLERRQSRQPSLDAGLLPARDAGRAVGHLARRADRHLAGLRRRPRPQGRRRLGGDRAAGRCRRASTIPTGTCWASWCATSETAPSSTSASRSPIARSTRSSTPGMPWACAARDRRTSRSRTCSCPSGARSRPGRSTASRIRARR